MYELRPPAPALAPYIENYWAVRGTHAQPLDLRVNVIVDARADLIFNLGAPYEREVIGGPTRRVQTSNLDAQRLAPIRITQRGAVHLRPAAPRGAGMGRARAQRAQQPRPRAAARVGPQRLADASSSVCDSKLRLAPV